MKNPRITTPDNGCCHGTGWRRHPFYTDGRPCDCGWEPGGALRLAAAAAYEAELVARQAARSARRAARQAGRS